MQAILQDQGYAPPTESSINGVAGTIAFYLANPSRRRILLDNTQLPTYATGIANSLDAITCDALNIKSILQTIANVLSFNAADAAAKEKLRLKAGSCAGFVKDDGVFK